MSAFLGTHQNRFDAKGRVSIPAPFRTVLRAQAAAGESLVVLRPSHLHPCIEAWPNAAFASLAAPLGEIDVFSEDHDDLAASLYADAYPLDADKEGRIILPETLRHHAGLTEEVAFMGMGRTFQIWEPSAAARRRDEARARSRALMTRKNTAGAA
ncbi:cell division protein MraZ [Neoasaia chiangmaiensis NBRC 101099]|uniref:Transcriptional regulator MraZ n=1 Tax=Neoasaia chiangmaiensis TaxID=320497 RepID=A0A1U9KT99_9PROT|nr:division/cell wall cluster transcriptional repressor MraZ [Neoasaia chiangmaiensis]AQS88900.1 cell division/cell wall cluster transcriptional repressor MraZ [Neoasaia chiangmaiensis]GBR40455.1 cell division protein MraZ [Neoasaia chiangmaiensis NBRC 101099]GEN13891.1 transcriptional regulator MraZ [Neoasaia chiangmaiensis]